MQDVVGEGEGEGNADGLGLGAGDALGVGDGLGPGAGFGAGAGGEDANMATPLAQYIDLGKVAVNLSAAVELRYL